MKSPVIVCLDLEGVLVPEIWVNVALKTGIDELKITTREMPDYDALMKRRLAILDEHKLTIHDIQSVIGKMGPLEGAVDFVSWIRERCQVIILSDTFYQFAHPPHRQLLHADAEPEETFGGRVQIAQLLRSGRRRCLQRHRHVGRSPRRVLLLPSGSPSQRIPAISGHEHVRGTASTLRRGGKPEIAFSLRGN